jgi:hypothetical protein
MQRTGTLLVALFLGVASTPRLGATVYHSNGSAASVQALHNAALDGNTITLPAETFTWSTGVDISKALPQSASLSGPELVGGLSSLGFFVSFGPAIGKLI